MGPLRPRFVGMECEYTPHCGAIHRLRAVFDLVSHGADTYVGTGPRYPWGGLYGGQIVAQALRAASATIDEDKVVHSLRAYFIRRGDAAEPVRYEVDRIRNGRSFATRRVVARQAIGAILNLEASYQRAEESAVVQPAVMPDVPAPGRARGVVVVGRLRPPLRAARTRRRRRRSAPAG